MRKRTLSLDFHHFRLTAQDLVGITPKSVAGTCEARGIASHAASAAFFAFSMYGVTSASRKTSAAVAGLAIFGSGAGSFSFFPPFFFPSAIPEKNKQVWSGNDIIRSQKIPKRQRFTALASAVAFMNLRSEVSLLPSEPEFQQGNIELL